MVIGSCAVLHAVRIAGAVFAPLIEGTARVQAVRVPSDARWPVILLKKTTAKCLQHHIDLLFIRANVHKEGGGGVEDPKQG